MQPCPSQEEAFLPAQRNHQSHWREADNSCSYCGSLNNDVFMERLEAGTIKLSSTTKNYKTYLVNNGGEAFKQTFRNCPRDGTCTGPDDCTHWTTREDTQPKFYFYHLTVEQRKRFVELYNEKKIQFEQYGHFNVFPFFMVPVT